MKNNESVKISEACHKILPVFSSIAKEIWGKHIDEIKLRCEQKIMKTDRFASLSHDARCNPKAFDDRLLIFCKEYVLQISPRLLDLPENKLNRVLKHEAIHIGHHKHSKDFMMVATKFNAPFSEAMLERDTIAIQVKNDKGRFVEIMSANTIEEAQKKGMEYARKNPDRRVRLSY